MLFDENQITIPPMIFLFSLLSGCGDRFETIEISGVTVSTPAVAMLMLPAISLDKTKRQTEIKHC